MNPLEMFGIEGWVAPLAQVLLHSLWQGAVLALLTAGVLALLPRTRVKARYGLACGALALAVVLPVLTGLATSSISTTAPEAVSELATPAPAAAEAAATTVSSVVETDAVALQGSSTLSAGLQSLQPWLVALWLVGVALLTAWHLRSWRRAQALRYHGTQEVEARWAAACARLARRLKIRQPVALLASVRVAVPATLGWLRPVVLVPVAAFHGLAPQQLEALIAHELAHVRRHDYLINLLQVLAETLFFHSPALWWLSHQVRREREHCCDDLAVAVCGDRLLYAKALSAAESLRHAPALAMAATGGDLLGRIRRLAGRPAPRSRRADSALAGAALTLLLGAVLVAGLLLPSPTADAAGAQGASTAGDESFNGRWELEPRDDGRVSLRMHMRGPGSRWDSSFTMPAAHLSGRLEGRDATFALRREAGTFHFEGAFDRRGEGAGSFSFAPDPAFAQAMARLGFTGLTPRRHLELALHEISLAWVEELVELGYGDIGVNKLIEMAIHGVETDVIRALNAAGYQDIDASRLVELEIHGVSPAYISTLEAEDLRQLPLDRLVELKIHGIDGTYIAGLRQAGVEDRSAKRLVELKIHGVTPAYIAGLRDAGLEDLSAKRLVELKIHGVDGELIGALHRAGLDDLSPSRLVELKIHGVSPDFIDALAKLGYGDVSASQLVAMRIHGVSPELIRELQRDGYRDLTVDELIELKIHGFDRFLARRDRDAD